MLGELVNKILGIVGLRLSRVVDTGNNALSFDLNMDRLKGRDVDVNTVIDVGASNGCWSERIITVYPSAFYFLIEANSCHEDELKKFKKTGLESDYLVAVAGDTVGEVYFDKSDPFGGVASHVRTGTCNSRLPCVTIDSEVEKRNLKGPYLLKLDTHGFEVPIINGAAETLKNTNLIFVETYNFDILHGSLRFWEMCEFLCARGFRPIDLCEPMHRPKDGAFWQIDILFVKEGRAEFQSNQYD